MVHDASEGGEGARVARVLVLGRRGHYAPEEEPLHAPVRLGEDEAAAAVALAHRRACEVTENIADSIPFTSTCLRGLVV